MTSLERNSIDAAAARLPLPRLSPAHSRNLPAGFGLACRAGLLLRRDHGRALQWRHAGEANGEYRDVFLMSKGHGCMIQYVVLEEQGVLSRAISTPIASRTAVSARIPITGLPASPLQPARSATASASPPARPPPRSSRGATPHFLRAVGWRFQEGSTWEAMMMAGNLGWTIWSRSWTTTISPASSA